MGPQLGLCDTLGICKRGGYTLGCGVGVELGPLGPSKEKYLERERNVGKRKQI